MKWKLRIACFVYRDILPECWFECGCGNLYVDVCVGVHRMDQIRSRESTTLRTDFTNLIMIYKC